MELPPAPAPIALPGIIVDDAQAKLTGRWTVGTGLPGYVGDGYRYASPGNATARFEFTPPVTGRYEVRLAHQPHANRATNTDVVVIGADGSKILRVNQRAAPAVPPTFVSLGVFRFEAGKTAAVEIRARDASGLVHADAVQVLPATQ